MTNIDLLKDTVGKTLRTAMGELGCPDLPMGLFSDKQVAFLREGIQDLPADDLELERLLIEGAANGKVIRSGQTPLGQNLFTVRFRVKNVACVMTFAYYRDEWALHHIEALQTRFREWNRLLFGGVIGSVLTAVVTFVFWGTGSGDLVAEAKAKGYVVMTEQQYEENLGGKEATPAAGASAGADAKAPAKEAGSTAKTAETLEFTLGDGAPLDDLLSFMKDKGLIDDKAAFSQALTERGIDTQIKPKTYAFKKGMSQEELFSVLQN
ncbi:hypothetical protein [Tumebacillus flagellatus]|uniref:Uncharacterized protein n=1 Tax=Tumebacillus flagellatus TaxID=1157490 RepID=A0A074LVP2_9BACL|nr:hypothetical protein [Tumebacillus flagellatus]KEO84600.1 hypothetical protein EL26_03530 [Tumebacillus flagellatus]